MPLQFPGNMSSVKAPIVVLVLLHLLEGNSQLPLFNSVVWHRYCVIPSCGLLLHRFSNGKTARKSEMEEVVVLLRG